MAEYRTHIQLAYEYILHIRMCTRIQSAIQMNCMIYRKNRFLSKCDVLCIDRLCRAVPHLFQICVQHTQVLYWCTSMLQPDIHHSMHICRSNVHLAVVQCRWMSSYLSPLMDNNKMELQITTEQRYVSNEYFLFGNIIGGTRTSIDSQTSASTYNNNHHDCIVVFIYIRFGKTKYKIENETYYDSYYRKYVCTYNTKLQFKYKTEQSPRSQTICCGFLCYFFFSFLLVVRYIIIFQVYKGWANTLFQMIKHFPRNAVRNELWSWSFSIICTYIQHTTYSIDHTCNTYIFLLFLLLCSFCFLILLSGCLQR